MSVMFLMVAGPGPWSVDAVLGRARNLARRSSLARARTAVGRCSSRRSRGDLSPSCPWGPSTAVARYNVGLLGSPRCGFRLTSYSPSKAGDELAPTGRASGDGRRGWPAPSDTQGLRALRGKPIELREPRQTWLEVLAAQRRPRRCNTSSIELYSKPRVGRARWSPRSSMPSTILAGFRSRAIQRQRRRRLEGGAFLTFSSPGARGHPWMPRS